MHLKPTAIAVRTRLREGPATTAELGNLAGFRFGGRIHELREAGYVIDSRRLRAASTVYTLVAEPGDEASEPKAAA